MKFSYSWLKDLSGYNGTPEKLAESLSMHAFETEVISGTEFKNIIVARVTKIEPHPNADRLRIITLTDGSTTYSPVICGAWNFDVDALVALALPGAVIPHDQHDPSGKPFTLAKATIRGVESQGMICSGKELGLSDDGKGIMILSRDYKLGDTFVAAGSETYLEISQPANRPDLLGYVGVAREISAIMNTKFTSSPSKIELDKFKPKVLKVHLSSQKLCPRYIAVRLSNIEVKSSPDFIQDRLRLTGRKPINNVVDITNYVMLETGQPLHAFDAAKIFGSINVRTAYLNEKLVTLDGVERKLNPQNLVIADSKQPIALAGVIGGANSLIDEFTTEVVLEAANFDAVSVRKTAREQNIRTDASSKFEKSLSPALADYAAAYAVELLIKYAGAKVLESYKAGDKLLPAKRIAVDPEKINSLLGLKLSSAEQKKILLKFHFKVEGRDKLNVVVPFFRSDITIWQDLAEEVARYIGLSEIDNKPTNVIPSFELDNPLVDARQKAAELLAGMGFSEIYTYSFVSLKDLEIWDIDKRMGIEVANPLSLDQEYLRPNILMNISKVAENNSRYESDGDYFEIGNIYWKDGKHILEKTYLGMFSFAKDYPNIKLVSAFKEFCRRLNIDIQLEQESEQIAIIKSGKEILGRIGRVGVGDIKWVGVHVEFEELMKLANPKTFSPIPKYPSIELDVAVWARRDLPWNKIEDIIRSVGTDLIQKVELFDIYTGKNVPMHKKSVAFRITYQSPEKTLTEGEVTAIHNQVLKELKARLNLEVR